MIKVFIDGKEGTTGLRIYDRLSQRNDVELILLPEEKRKDAAARKEAIFAADTVFLCLPDAAAIDAVELGQNSGARFIDASCAHRTAPGWDYGFPELSPGHRAAVAASSRVANPGCHASGFIALVYPLVKNKLLSPDAALSCFSLTGYSGGGKKMIADYEAPHRDPLLCAPRQYGLSQGHKHLPEMKKVTGISSYPVFMPVVADFYSGMEVTVPLHRSLLSGGAGAEDIKKLYRELYAGPVVRYTEASDEGGFMSAARLSGSDAMEISVCGSEDRIVLTARYDNLGKGASGAAVQCFNIMHGVEETEGLALDNI